VNSRSPASIWLLALVALLLLVAAPFLGRPTLSPISVWQGAEGSIDTVLFWKWRLPRTLAAFLVGMALALGGTVFQAIFRNALATPFTLGISSGASFGATLAVQLSLVTLFPGWPVRHLAAFGGAILAVVLVHGLSRMKRGFSTTSLLLAGVAVSYLFASAIMLFQYLGAPDKSMDLLHWMMGGIFVSGMGSAMILLPPVAIGTLVILLQTRELDLLLLGDELARSRGLDIRRLHRLLFVTVSLMLGFAVALCGPIGFVGLMVPHVCRLLFGACHAQLVPASALAGGILLVVCDTLARTLISPAEMPIGIITAVLGAPFFLWLLYAGRTEL